MRPLHDEHHSPKASNDADSDPTLRTRVRGIYLTAPLDAQAWAQVQTGLSSRLSPHLMGAYTGQTPPKPTLRLCIIKLTGFSGLFRACYPCFSRRYRLSPLKKANRLNDALR